MYDYEAILASQVLRVERAYPTQITDRSHPAHGAFLSETSGAHPNADHGANASLLASACCVLLADGSRLKGNAELCDRVQWSIAFQRRWQRPSGLIDLVGMNFESPPDTGFAVQLLAPAVELARAVAAAGDSQAAAIADSLGRFVRAAAVGMIDRGFHTPNHRWVVCSALAQAMTLFPEIKAGPYVERILAETVDINEDGEYTERSSGVYNAVCNRSLRFMAHHLGQPDLLDPVRRNLDMMSHLFHEDGTIDTSFSNRQDRGQRIVPVAIADSFFDLAQRDGNGVWARIADELVAAGEDAAHSPWLLQPFLANPEYRRERLARKPRPDHYAKHYPASGLWRVRRGPLSATAATGSRAAFAVRYGDVNLRSVKFSGTYLLSANFSADRMAPIDGGMRLERAGRAHPLPGYELPLGRPLAFGSVHAARPSRQRWTLPPIDLRLDIREVENGFDLRYLTRGGLDRIPIEIECAFEGPGEWETADQVTQVTAGMTSVLKSGHGTFRRGDQAIRIGPGSGVHYDWQMRESEPSLDSFRVLITLQTPVDRTLEIRYGSWSLATRSLAGA